MAEEYPTRYVIQNEHKPEECEQAFGDWTALQNEHPEVDFIPEGIVCGCMNGDHRGILIFADEDSARTALKYERVGESSLVTWSQVPLMKAA